MQFSIQSEIFDKFPELKIGILVVNGLDNSGDYPALREKFQMIQEDLQRKYKTENFDEIEEIIKWRTNLKKAKIDNSKHPVSIQAMMKRIIKDQKWIAPLNPLVDLYNTISLEKLIPMGAYDIDKSGDNLEMRLARKDDQFLPLGKDKYENCDEGEIIFADENEVLCRKWVWKQSDKQKIQKRTQNVIFRIEGINKSKKELEVIMTELTNLIESTVGGEISSFILDKSSPEAQLPKHQRTEYHAKEKLVNRILNRGVAEINIREDLEAELWSGRKLRIKLGIDPTGFDLTLGHAVVLRKLKHFQDAGHQICFLIGNFTAQIGDPTGKSQTRKVLTKEEVMKNAQSYLDQAAKVLDISKFEIVYNADWLEAMSFSDVLSLAGNFTVAQMLERDMFQERIKANKEINLVEFMYPLMQGYDSVPMKADVEVGGTDQLFNMMAARPIMRANEMKAQNVVTVPILVGLDGTEKMSKSLGNYIGILDSAKDMYGKTMSIPDHLIINYFELATEVEMEEIAEIKKELAKDINPRDIKARLAYEITKLYHGENAAKKAGEEFTEIFQKGGLPDDIPEKQVSDLRLISLLVEVGFCSSNGEARRAIEGGGVKLEGQKISDVNTELEFKHGEKKLLQLGKRNFVYLLIK